MQTNPGRIIGKRRRNHPIPRRYRVPATGREISPTGFVFAIDAEQQRDLASQRFIAGTGMCERSSLFGTRQLDDEFEDFSDALFAPP
ncbi:hypothetical protein Hoch_2154 [Haliangium ochraceum DSM 14365]|uniref:Uncharacterized protein n=1 Tax=Haliangium ochraceum (strain DSM 14365 / JCM 11303 / SMP-2) TaxID=502025 RepID=D0LGX7_HALO1|nr:hypothetical protein Hoch_2154 [Haliangium ochraceum DSM 14365]